MKMEKYLAYFLIPCNYLILPYAAVLPIIQRLPPTLSKNTPQVETETASPEESEVPSVDTETQ